MNITPENLNFLATNYTPDPVLQGISQMSQAPYAANDPFAAHNLLMPSQGQPQAPGGFTPPGGTAPLDLKSMQMLQSMMPQPGKPQFIGGASPGRGGGGNINLSMPGMPAMPAAPTPQGVPSLYALINGRM